MTVVAQPVATSRQRQQFLELPWQLYRDDPLWIPPLRQNQKELAGFARHPFYADAEAQTFLALRAGKPCGRIAAIVNHAHNRQHNERRGFFGFLETVNDLAVAQALFAAAKRWLRERGMHSVRGPLSPSFNYEMGCLVEGFHSPPTFMMPYNPSFYGPLIEQCGFRKVQDLYSLLGHTDQLQTMDEKVPRVAEEAGRRLNVKLRHLDKRRFAADVRTFLGIFNEANRGHWGFVKPSEAELDHMSQSLRYLVEPDFTTLAEIDGRPIGAMFGLLDYNPRVKLSDGRLFPFGFLRLLFNRRKINKLRVVATLVLPEYQLWGVGVLLMHHIRPKLLEWPMGPVEFSWVAESNPLSLKTLERGGARRDKTFRIYDADLD